MSETIKDGSGTGYLAKVNSNNELRTRATIIEERLHAAIDNIYYELSTGIITLTDAVEKGIIYFINNGTFPLIIDRVLVDTWTSTGATTLNGIMNYHRNPVVTGGTPILPINSNFQSTGIIPVGGLKSLTTMTGLNWTTGSIAQNSTVVLIEGRLVVPAGFSFGISYTAPVGNTHQDISMNVGIYEFDPALIGL